VTVRPARPDDLPALRDLERAAGAAFRELGMDAIADDEPPGLAALAAYQREGCAWVVADEGDRPVAYLLVELLDGAAHVEQVSVDPGHARRGLGRTLIDTAADWARRRGIGTLTLSTFADVPWNAPYYARLGFEVIPETDLTDGLRRIRAHEAAGGLDAWPRVVMRRGVRPG
jgi:GNAT superfamily N-acetyltransferase